RQAGPAAATTGDDGKPRTLRFDFPGEGSDGRGRRLEHVDWDSWLGVFADPDLAFQERRRDGSPSNFFRLDAPSREDG
ncbi:MAG TPA: hypothetical protein VLA80_03550, partial [Actinomycetota bacterium]|nr:hypothetical protein [Actinomycetota bacterium]